MGARSRRTVDVEPGESSPSRARSRRACSCCSRGRCRRSIVDGERIEPVGASDAPTWIGAIADAHRDGALGARMQRRDRVPPGARSRPRSSAAWRSRSRPMHRRVMRQVAPVMSRFTAIEQSRERLAVARHDGRGPRARAEQPGRRGAPRRRPQLAEALDVIGSTLGRFVEAGIEREEAERIVALQRAGLRQCADRARALDALDAADAEDELRERLEALGVAGAVAAGRAAGGRRRRRGVARARARELAGPATRRALRWVAAIAQRAAARSELRESTERMSRLSARSSPTRTWTAAASSRSTSTRASRRR